MAEYSTQDPKIISVFEIIGGYFTDTIFNHIYASAKTNLKGGSSITDEYVRRLQAYMTGIKNDEKCYSDVIQGVHRYFTRLTRYTTLSFSAFVDRIVGVCVPEKYFQAFSPTDKDELLSSIVCDLVSNLIVYAAKPDMLRRIIDEHEKAPSVTIRMLQDTAISSLLAKRALVNNKFMTKAGQAREHVPMDVVEGMKDALRRLVREKAEALELAAKATDRLARAESQLADERVKNGKAMKMIGLLREGPQSRFKPPHETIAESQPRERDSHSKPPERETIAEIKHVDPLPVRSENTVRNAVNSTQKDAGKFQLTDFFKKTATSIAATSIAATSTAATSTAAVPAKTTKNPSGFNETTKNTSGFNETTKNTSGCNETTESGAPQSPDRLDSGTSSPPKKNARIFDDIGGNDSN